MRRLLAACLVVASSASATTGLAPVAATAEIVPLKNADFEQQYPPDWRCPPHWSCITHSDASSHRFFIDDRAPANGKRSLCVERVRDEPWALATQGLFDTALRGRRLRLSISVRLEAASAGAGPWVMVQGGAGNQLFHDERLVKGTRAWQRIELDFSVPSEAAVIEVGAALHGGGKMCIDDARLEILPIVKSPV